MADEAMAGAPDVLVLPELWDLGFYPADVRELSDAEGREAEAFLGGLAREHGVNIVGGSIARRTQSGVRNSCMVFDRRGGLAGIYDKCHLFSPGHEDRHFEAGDEAGLFDLDGIRAGVLICYDLRFGEFAGSLALQGAKLLFVPAAWPRPRLDHWQLLCRSRAVENQCFVAAANGCGQLGKLSFCGHSVIVDPSGAILAEAAEDAQCVTAGCDPALVEAARARLPVFTDRRPELYAVCARKDKGGAR